MSLRVAVWCPHGRETLPPAAAACRDGLPSGWIVWSSEHESVPLPRVGGADLWLVLCSDVPPPPPQWRAELAGVLAVFPGPAAGWTVATQAAVAAWRPDIVLSDALPDETDNPVHEQWTHDTRWRWIPGGIGGGATKSRGPVVAVVTDRNPGDWFAENVLSEVSRALGGGLARLQRQGPTGEYGIGGRPGARLLLDGENPVAWDSVLRTAISERSRIVMTSRGAVASLRAFLLADIAICVDEVAPRGDRLNFVRHALRMLAKPPSNEVGGECEWGNWSAWLKSLIGASEGATEPLRAVAHLTRGWSGWSEGKRKAPVAFVLRKWFRDSVPGMWRTGASPGFREEMCILAWCLERLVRVGWSELLDEHMLARVQAYLGNIGRAESALTLVLARRDEVGCELPGSVALALWRQGQNENARLVLCRYAAKPKATPFACFVCAVAAEMVLERGVVAVQLDELLRLAPGILREDTSGACVALAVLVARTAGERLVTERLIAETRSHTTEVDHLLGLGENAMPRTEPVDGRWRALFDHLSG